MAHRLTLNGRSICFDLLLIFIIDSVFHITRVVTGGSNIVRLMILMMMVVISFLGNRKMTVIKLNDSMLFIVVFVFLAMMGYLKSILLNGDIQFANRYFSSGIIYFLFLPILVYLIDDRKYYARILKAVVWIGTILSSISVLLIITSFILPSLYSQIVAILMKYDALNAISAYSGIVRIMLNGIVFQVIALFIAISMFYKSDKKIIVIILIAVNIVGIILTYTRGLIFGVGVAGIIWLIVNQGKEKKRTRILIAVGIVFFTGIVLYSLLGTHGNIFGYVFDRFLKKEAGTVESDIFRDEIKRLAYDKIFSAPLFGSGLGSHIDLRDGEIEMTYIDIVIRVGIMGLFCFLYPYFKMVRGVLKNMISLEEKALFCVLTCVMVASFTNPYLITSGGIFIYSLCICAYYKNFSQKNIFASHS